MNKLNFVSNPRIIFFAKGTEHEDGTYIRPDQIPALILPALSNAARYELILSVCIFADEYYENYAKALMTTWDGITVMKRCAKLFGDGSYDWIESDGHTVWDMM